MASKEKTEILEDGEKQVPPEEREQPPEDGWQPPLDLLDDKNDIDNEK